MKRRYTAILAMSVLTIGSSSVTMAAPEDIADIVAYCTSDTNLPATICTCLGEKAGLLTDLQQQTLAATLTDDEAAATALRAQLTIQEATEVATFFIRQPAACAAAAM